MKSETVASVSAPLVTPCRVHGTAKQTAPNEYVTRGTELPQEAYSDDHYIEHGYAVQLGAQWLFFTAQEPAVAFGRAGRMSRNVTSYDVYTSAQELTHCLDHGDETVFWVGDSIRGRSDEADVLGRFVRGVEEHPESSHWHAPTGPTGAP